MAVEVALTSDGAAGRKQFNLLTTPDSTRPIELARACWKPEKTEQCQIIIRSLWPPDENMLNQILTRRLMLTSALVIASLFVFGCDQSPATGGSGSSTAAAPDPVTDVAPLATNIPAEDNFDSEATGVSVTVDLTIDFNGQAGNKTVAVPCSGDSTVFSTLERAMNMGDLEFESSGRGESAFVISIDDVENQRAAGDNWTYRVNGELADRGCGVYDIQPGDQIMWHFGEYEE